MKNFKKHKEIRKKLKSAIKKGTLGLIDIGSSKIVCIIIKFSEISKNPKNLDQIDENNRIAYRVVGVATKKSVGIKKGEIIIAEEVEKTIRLVVQQSQKMAASLIDEVVVTFSGGQPISKNLYQEIRTQNQTVSTEDINNLLSKYNFQIYPDNREIMHAMPINFSLDEKTGLTDPRGLVGHTLGLDINLVTVKKNVLDNIHQCLQNCQLSLAGIFFSPYISAKSSLVEDELKLGAACIDMGAGTTGISIFYNHQLIFASNIRFGSENITSDIMQAFQLSFNEAERIKTLHGGLVVTNLDDNELIELSFRDANKEYYNYIMGIPSEVKMKQPKDKRWNDGEYKYLAREGLKGVLPEYITGKIKTGWSIPDAQWKRTEGVRKAALSKVGNSIDNLVNWNANIGGKTVYSVGYFKEWARRYNVSL
mgnify:CR=1 FL=1